MTIRELWASMPRDEKIGALVFPPLLITFFTAVWAILPA